MSALGQKQTCAPQKAMSAITQIATAKADSRKGSCLLYPRKQTCAVHSLVPAMGHKRTFAVSFDNLVGTGYERWRHSQTERLGSLEVDDQLVFGRQAQYLW